jgi:hypothetical protein
LARRADGTLTGDGDAQRNAAHLAQAQDHASFGVSLHHALDDFAALIGGAILKECHALTQPYGFRHFGFWIADFGLADDQRLARAIRESEIQNLKSKI